MSSSLSSSSTVDPYRSHLVGEGEENTLWRHGAPPSYDLVNKLFETTRTKVGLYIFLIINIAPSLYFITKSFCSIPNHHCICDDAHSFIFYHQS